MLLPWSLYLVVLKSVDGSPLHQLLYRVFKNIERFQERKICLKFDTLGRGDMPLFVKIFRIILPATKLLVELVMVCVVAVCFVPARCHVIELSTARLFLVLGRQVAHWHHLGVVFMPVPVICLLLIKRTKI